MKIHLISYGDAKYASQRAFFKETALESLFFDEVIVFNNEDLDFKFISEFYEIFQLNRGGGYWIWKPYLIKKALDNLKDNDILIYCDSGCIINNNGKERFNQYIDILMTSKTGMLSFELPHKEYEYTKHEVFDYFNTPEDHINSNQLMATVILLRKCAHTVMLIDKWLDTLYDRPSLFTDELESIRHNKFIDHRHDQSIFSVIRKSYGTDIIPDETYFLDFLREGYLFPFWATRLRS